MDMLLEIFAEYMYSYSKDSAGMASYRGSYEETVPVEFSEERR